mgnify:CR=1 FL=1
MQIFRTLVALSTVAVGLAAPSLVEAKVPDPVQCSMTADYSINNVVRAPFQHDFVFVPGEVYDFDFSTAVRFRYFQAQAAIDEKGRTVVSINYYNDVGVFTFVELDTKVTVANNNEEFVSEGESTFFTSLGPAGEHTTTYALRCRLINP